TNRHVVLNGTRIDVYLPDGRVAKNVRRLGDDARSDIAVVQIRDLKDLPVAVLGDSDKLEVGEWVIAIGAPFDLESSVSAGIVSATGRTSVIGNAKTDRTEDFIQTDAALNPGNSGGALINLDGQVVGVNTAIASPMSHTNAGVGFAIPINLARTVAISIIETGLARRGYLGIIAAPVTAAELKRLGIDATGALLTSHVVPGSAAARAGLKKGDLLLDVGGRPLRDLASLRAKLSTAGPGSEVRFTVQRDKTRHLISVRLAEEPLYSFGIDVAALDDEARAAAGVPSHRPGIVVAKVHPDSAALIDPKQPLLAVGDVIVGVALPRQRMVSVNSPSQFLAQMREWEPAISRGVPVSFILEDHRRLYRVKLLRR
ncbi:MAG: trypsin-like peptidase domain-containing protein, partial [Planctomycetota bacterium]